MILMLLRLAIVLLSLPAMAADAKYQEQWNKSQSSYLVFVSSAACTNACNSKYIECGKGHGGRDMKQCVSERKVCYRNCPSAASSSECTNVCNKKYIECGKGRSGKDMKQCSDDRKVCYRRCQSN